MFVFDSSKQWNTAELSFVPSDSYQLPTVSIKLRIPIYGGVLGFKIA